MASDFELLDAWAAGDRGAGGELFRRHFQAVFRFFRNKIDGGVEDLVQQTFLGCIEGRHRFRRESGFVTWLLATARNVLLLEYRRRRRKDDRIDFGTMSAMDLAPSPVSVLTEKVQHRLVLEALRTIPLDYQIALELYLWEGLTGPQLAEVLGLSEPGVRSRLARAKEALRKRVAQLQASPEDLSSTVADLEAWAASLRDAMRERK